MAPPNPAIELIDADILRGRVPALLPVLEKVSWRIESGQFWAVGGSPGSGKTDLLCTAAALQRPNKGYHLIFGRDTREMEEEELVVSHQKVAMVFEGGRLFPNLTVAENLALPLAYHLGSRRTEADVTARVERLIDHLQLRHVSARFPTQVTRSLHQRVGLARALMLQPDVLLIDNPVAGVDARHGRWWLDFLGQINKGHEINGGKPVTVVVATDDFRPWMETAERFGLIKGQTFEVVGGREELRQSRQREVHELLSSAFGPL